jgi:hypothetical protein
MGNCRCCRRDPFRQCRPCFITQKWRTTFPPDRVVTREDDSLLDTIGGNGDSTGECSDFLDRDFSHVWTHDRYPFQGQVDAKDGDGNYIQRTVTDDLQQPVEFYSTVKTQLMTNGRLYPFIPVNVNRFGGSVLPVTATLAHGGNLVDAVGYYHVPLSALTDRTYTKTFDGSFGHDFHSWDPDLLDKNFNYTGGVVSPFVRGEYRLAKFANVFCDIEFRIQGDQTGSKTERERIIFVRSQGGNLKDPNQEVGVMTFGEYLESGLQFSLVETVDQNGNIEAKLKILNTGQEIDFLFEIGEPRCVRPAASLVVYSFEKKAFSSNKGMLDEDLYNWPADLSNDMKWIICSPVNLAWLLSTADPDRLGENYFGPAVNVGWLGLLSVDGTNTDTTMLSCKRVDLFRHNQTVPFMTVEPEAGERTIADGTLIDFDAGFNDLYRVTFDNESRFTAEVTNVTFLAPLVTGVDRTTETFTGFERNKFDFNGADPDGLFPPAGLQTSNLVFTHDSGGNLIPSPFTITLRSSKGVVPT